MKTRSKSMCTECLFLPTNKSETCSAVLIVHAIYRHFAWIMVSFGRTMLIVYVSLKSCKTELYFYKINKGLRIVLIYRTHHINLSQLVMIDLLSLNKYYIMPIQAIITAYWNLWCLLYYRNSHSCQK